jgi:hypothetical protein
MSFRLLTSMLFILTHSVLAQASGNMGSLRIETQKWVTSYAGETELDGLPVIVNLDESQGNLGIPEIMAGMSSVVPTEAVTPKRSFRLNLIVAHNPAIRAIYKIEPRSVPIAGSIRLAYLSQLDERGFQFMATVQDDGSVLVSYTRKTTLGGTLNGQITLSPVPRILAK